MSRTWNHEEASFEAADWHFHGPEWGGVREVTRGAPIPCMELAPAVDEADREGWHRLCRAWQALPPHQTSIELVELDGDIAVLRFAAIDWTTTPLGERDIAELVQVEGFILSRCLHVVHVFQRLIETVDPEHWRWFQNPRVVFDLRGEPRVVWLPVPREAWSASTERALVEAVGRVLGELGLGRLPERRLIVGGCLTGSTRKLSEVEANLRFIQAIELPSRSRVWDLVEEGIGWYELNQLAFAGMKFDSALAIQPNNELAREGRRLCAHTEDVARARQLEADRAWPDAIAAYRRARRSMERADYLVAIARCELGRGARLRAFDVAKYAFKLAPDRVDVASAFAEAALQWDYTKKPLIALQRIVVRSPEHLPSLIGLIGRVVDVAISKARLDEVEMCAGMLLSVLADHPMWSDVVAPLVVRISEAVQPVAALELFQTLEPLAPEHAAQALALLIKRLGASPSEPAVAVCDRLFQRSATEGIAAYAQVIEGRLRRGDHADALALADQLLGLAPDSGLGHYRRARCLFGLGRLFEARDELDRAQALDPMLVEAMVVRREVDRAIAKVREAAGTAQPQQLAIPPHLGEVRIAMSRGKLDEAVRLLQAHDANDEAAQLLLGQLLLAIKPDEAVVAFDRVTGELVHRARIGKAKALALLDRSEEALRLLDRVCAEEPRLGDAMRARKALLSARDFVTSSSRS